MEGSPKSKDHESGGRQPRKSRGTGRTPTMPRSQSKASARYTQNMKVAEQISTVLSQDWETRAEKLQAEYLVWRNDPGARKELSRGLAGFRTLVTSIAHICSTVKLFKRVGADRQSRRIQAVQLDPVMRERSHLLLIAELFHKLSYFKDMTAIQQENLAQTVLFRRHVKRDILFQAGDSADHFFVIISGQVLLTRQDSKKTLHVAGEFYA
ncbi:hypothetical protein CYMTET_46977, partial [Cymbomonas tetramitiformis]